MAQKMTEDDIKREVRRNYARTAKRHISCCESGSGVETSEDRGKIIGYSKAELDSVPEGANMGLGCGNPTAIASLKRGETVVDLGSGGGFDCFLAADKVGKTGRVIGVDMTSEMIEKARENARKGGYKNVEFRLGEIENLPVADNSVDIVISNCVINLVPNKKRVLSEAFRILKPGGRVIISDLVLLKKLPDEMTGSIAAYVGCVAGASMKSDYLRMMRDAGFGKVRILEETRPPVEVVMDAPATQHSVFDARLDPETAKDVADSVASIIVYAAKLKTK